MGQRVDVRRFSMCNCLTVHWPDTYTAHALTLEAFCRFAKPGRSWPIPRAELWPSGYVRLFRFPAAVRTFLFSPFNEAFCPAYVLDGVRVTIGPHKGAADLRGLAAGRPRYSPGEYALMLRRMAARADEAWAPRLKALVIYDSSRAGPGVRARVREYDRIAEETLGWPAVRVSDPDGRQLRWCHYGPRAHATARAELGLPEGAAGAVP